MNNLSLSSNVKNMFYNQIVANSGFLTLIYQKNLFAIKYKEVDMAFFDRGEFKILAYKKQSRQRC